MKRIQIIFCLVIAVKSLVGQNKTYDSLIYQLQIIDINDQNPRSQIYVVQEEFKNDSVLLIAHLDSLWRIIRIKDSINLWKITEIVDQFGWLGPEAIGDDGNSTLFLVIQHADLKTQEKYLPIMREAVKNGKAKAKNLAFLEDRVALREGRKQIYGTQSFWNWKTNEHIVLPLEDPYHIDTRRANVGLQPFSTYLEENYHTKWDVEQYLKDLPDIEKILQVNPL